MSCHRDALALLFSITLVHSFRKFPFYFATAIETYRVGRQILDPRWSPTIFYRLSPHPRATRSHSYSSNPVRASSPNTTYRGIGRPLRRTIASTQTYLPMMAIVPDLRARIYGRTAFITFEHLFRITRSAAQRWGDDI